MLTAKQQFMKVQYDLSTMKEESELEIQLKMKYVQEVEIKFAIWWTIFWCLFIIAFLIWIIAIMINYFNYSSRKKWRQMEYERLWYKIQTLKNSPNGQVTPIENTNGQSSIITPKIITPTKVEEVKAEETNKPTTTKSSTTKKPEAKTTKTKEKSNSSDKK